MHLNRQLLPLSSQWKSSQTKNLAGHTNVKTSIISVFSPSFCQIRPLGTMSFSQFCFVENPILKIQINVIQILHITNYWIAHLLVTPHYKCGHKVCETKLTCLMTQIKIKTMLNMGVAQLIGSL